MEDFHPISLEEKNKLFLKLCKDYDVVRSDEENTTIFTKKLSNGEVELRNNRPVLIVSSTSWTEDEDFSLLLDAFDGRLFFFFFYLNNYLKNFFFNFFLNF